MDLSTVSKDDFAEHLNETFRLELDGDSIELELIEAVVTGQAFKEGGREAFSILFRGPQQPILTQRLYPLVHPDMGAMDLFLVPIGSGPEGIQYESVFT